jgi:hypothetical protein
MSNDDILRMFACAAMQGMIARRSEPLPESAMNSLAKQAWLMACEMRLVEMENGEG